MVNSNKVRNVCLISSWRYNFFLNKTGTTLIMRKTIEILTGFFEGVGGFKSALASSQECWLPFLTTSCPLIVRVWLLLRLILQLQFLARPPDHTKSQCVPPSVLVNTRTSQIKKNPHSLFENVYLVRLQSTDELNVIAAAEALQI